MVRVLAVECSRLTVGCGVEHDNRGKLFAHVVKDARGQGRDEAWKNSINANTVGRGRRSDSPSVLMTLLLLSMGERMVVAARGMCWEVLCATATDMSLMTK